MVIKGNSVAGASRLAAHLQRTDTNERRNELIEMRDVAATDLRGALREMEAVATGCPNCKKPFYHASINTPSNERLSDEQRMQAVDRLEKELGLTGQPRVVVAHEKKDGREHCHVVWSRIDLEKMRTISDSHNFRKHELVARDLEREFGHERVQGAHIERDGQPRPDRTPSHKEHQQGERTGVSAKQAKEHITALWRSTDNGKAFAEALKDSGWLLARGDRRDFVALDPQGGTHSLARRIEGATAKEVRARLSDLDLSQLPSVAEARETQRARSGFAKATPDRQARQRETERPATAAPAREPAKARTAAPDARAAPRARTGGGGAARATPEPAPAKAGAGAGLGRALGGFADALFRLLIGESSSPSREESTAPTSASASPQAREAEQQSNRRQELLRDYGREVTPGTERDAEIERDRKARESRDGGGRERTRGE